jgi:hypothetical protein
MYIMIRAICLIYEVCVGSDVSDRTAFIALGPRPSVPSPSPLILDQDDCSNAEHR